MHRRDAVATLLSGLAWPWLSRTGNLARKFVRVPDFAAIERHVAGRLGVAVLDVTTKRRLVYRAEERFPMCSTFKWLLVAQVLSRIDAGQERLSRVLPYGEVDLLAHAPVTRAHVRAGGMSVSDLAAAAIQYSDNTAANLLLQMVGGPASLTAYLRQLGDRASRLDRMEPELNTAVPGDVRDTTTPSAMLANMHALLIADRLDHGSRDRLLDWLAGNTTGAEKLRAGLPTAWRVGDKTGMGAHGATNDVAIVWPTRRRPVLIAAYLIAPNASADARNDALARVGREVAVWLGGV